MARPRPEKAGRLTEPMRYDAASDRYLPVSWDEAFAEIGAELRAMDPKEAVFYASGHAGLEASYLYALFARAMRAPEPAAIVQHVPRDDVGEPARRYIGTPVGTCTLEDFDAVRRDLLLRAEHRHRTARVSCTR